ncbi:threonine dehydratase [Caldalkalibacillus uzonensis]|uniref:L-threonine dehydratase catabolic TdcB n=1 Tax=Caldalkalibacillus uzonensis TaxID=353224 RepID=A0ABU0CQ84_9BACI|nr:threonine ammonia-lyase [Caldalkalibacillus uzonensis]MDQ0337680.1 threonine dehydratase [Caldalkalibacillus uzonensis]
MLSQEDIKTARQVVSAIAHTTPLDFSHTYSTLTNNEVYLKLENLQKTGSFKIRGAYNKLMSLTAAEKKRGVVAASAGNHAQGVAYSSSRAQINCTVVMPEGAPLAKVEATKNYGANVILHGHTFDEALAFAQMQQQQTGAVFVHAFDDPHVIAGQGTIGLEILEQLPNVDSIVCPIGGGGLIAGIALAVKASHPHIKVYGVQAAQCPSMLSSLNAQQLVQVTTQGTIADGIAVKRPGKLTFDLVQQYVDDVVTVSEDEIARTMLYLLERSKLLVEGSGAVSLAALLNGKLNLKQQKVAVIISGGNVDITFVSRIIELGLIEAGRYLSIVTVVPDRPGNLSRLLTLLADLKANVISVNHYRISPRLKPGQTEIEIAMETRDHKHIKAIETKLTESGYHFIKKV